MSSVWVVCSFLLYIYLENSYVWFLRMCIICTAYLHSILKTHVWYWSSHLTLKNKKKQPTSLINIYITPTMKIQSSICTVCKFSHLCLLGHTTNQLYCLVVCTVPRNETAELCGGLHMVNILIMDHEEYKPFTFEGWPCGQWWFGEKANIFRQSNKT